MRSVCPPGPSAACCSPAWPRSASSASSSAAAGAVPCSPDRTPSAGLDRNHRSGPAVRASDDLLSMDEALPVTTGHADPVQVLRVVVVDDHRMFTEALAATLSDEPDLRVVGTFG